MGEPENFNCGGEIPWMHARARLVRRYRRGFAQLIPFFHKLFQKYAWRNLKAFRQL